MDIGNSAQRGFDAFFAFIPNILGFLVILIIGYVIAKVVATVVRKALDGLHLDRHLHDSDASKYTDRFMPQASPSNGIARVVFWLIFLFFLVSAIGALKIPAVTTFMNQVLAYLPNIIVAIVIFVLAALIAGAAAAGIAKLMGDTPTGKIAASVVPGLVMVIAIFMVLDQLRIAPEIVTIAFAATMGALALGLALAFGLGGRDVAARLLEDAYSKGREQREQVKSDLQTGRDRAQDRAEQAKDQLDSGTGSGSTTSSTTTSGTTTPGTTTQFPPASDGPTRL
jgi:hypothetical protein